jgi:hypothetical protein
MLCFLLSVVSSSVRHALASSPLYIKAYKGSMFYRTTHGDPMPVVLPESVASFCIVGSLQRVTRESALRPQNIEEDSQ